jgi:hypothetical protein
MRHVLHDVSAGGDFQGLNGVLLDEQDGCPAAMDILDDPEQLLDEQRRQTEGRLIQQQLAQTGDHLQAGYLQQTPQGRLGYRLPADRPDDLVP